GQQLIDLLLFLIANVSEQADAIIETGGNCLPYPSGFIKVPMQFRRNEAYTFLNFPNAFTATAWLAKQLNVVCIRLRVVARNQAQQRGFSRAVMPLEQPFLSCADGPIDSF